MAKIRSNKFLLKHLVIKTSDKKYERRFDHSTVIFKLEFMNKNCLIFEMFFIRDLKPKLNKQSDSIRAKLLLNTSNSFHSFHFLFTLHFRIALFLLFVCKYLAFTFVPLFQKLYICGIVIQNLKMTVERSKRRSYFLSLVFITKLFVFLAKS